MDSDSTQFRASAPLPGASIPSRGPSRRTFLTTTAALGIGAVAGTGIAGIAWGAPPPDCGSPSDSSKTNGRFWLWDQVKGCTPAQPGSNLYVKQISASPNRFYAIRRGGDNPHGNNDMLLMPTNRISGIECSYLRHDPPNWWAGAWREAVANIPAKPSSPLALGVNSKDRRGQDQLHIHLSQVFYPTFSDLRQIQPVTKISDWMTPQANVELRINDRHKTPLRKTAWFRVVKYTGALPNLFAELAKVLPATESMEHQVVGAVWTGIGSTYYLINSTALKTPKGPGTGLLDYIYNWPANKP
ncbi:CDP-diacylglycerol diphosphatase [Gordonia sp. L191]|uniref:CDP-diacylglycerol diphosphatase n=1 Tax=Gordonia sp. L191 TaxID=2982699 RepID=UPI0024C06E8F|nr:CDP-diacylglycerol diphosphatase [Gordonia sp. L191]WHU48283.1 CDP-diacylglycerol diphosphatase [Gordonia sp. L191]